MQRQDITKFSSNTPISGPKQGDTPRYPASLTKRKERTCSSKEIRNGWRNAIRGKERSLCRYQRLNLRQTKSTSISNLWTYSRMISRRQQLNNKRSPEKIPHQLLSSATSTRRSPISNQWSLEQLAKASLQTWTCRSRKMVVSIDFGS